MGSTRSGSRPSAAPAAECASPRKRTPAHPLPGVGPAGVRAIQLADSTTPVANRRDAHLEHGRRSARCRRPRDTRDHFSMGFPGPCREATSTSSASSPAAREFRPPEGVLGKDRNGTCYRPWTPPGLYGATERTAQRHAFGREFSASSNGPDGVVDQVLRVRVADAEEQSSFHQCRLSCLPVLNPELTDPQKLAFVLCYQRKPQATCMGRDEQVIRADECPSPL